MNNKSKDLGTYYLRVEFKDGTGYIEQWFTGIRLTNGRGAWFPLSASLIPATWRDENELFSSMLYQYENGNYSCDCNKAMFLARANQQTEQDSYPCGDAMEIKRLTAIRPDATEQVLFDDAADLRRPHE